MTARVRELLLAGEYLCEYRWRDEAKVLDNLEDREKVDAWLRQIDKNLARLGANGAWFMTPLKITDSMTTSIRTELRNFRDTYGPAVRILDFVRHASGERILCSPGDRIQLVTLETHVTSNTTAATALKEMVQTVIASGSTRFTDRENLRKMMEHLAKDGYVVLVDRTNETYQVTGKVEQLYAVLTFLDENKVFENAPPDQLELGDEAETEGTP